MSAMPRMGNSAFDYDALGKGYSSVRQEDPRIAAFLGEALGDSRTVLNVGAGAGSYEPHDRWVVAVEPSGEMRSQRRELGKRPAIAGAADSLPFDDDSFDATMALLTVHHWADLALGLRELKRVAKSICVVMTFDPDRLDDFWNTRYFPELVEVERRRYPSMAFLKECLGAALKVTPVPIPLDCKDGFQEAFYGRPEAFLREEVRAAQSAWGFLDEETTRRSIARLESDLRSGRWDELHGEHRRMPSFAGALRIAVYEKGE